MALPFPFYGSWLEDGSRSLVGSVHHLPVYLVAFCHTTGLVLQELGSTAPLAPTSHDPSPCPHLQELFPLIAHNLACSADTLKPHAQAAVVCATALCPDRNGARPFCH